MNTNKRLSKEAEKRFKIQREKLGRANDLIEVVEVSYPESINYDHVAVTFGPTYAHDLRIICNKVKKFRAKYPEVYMKVFETTFETP